MSDTVRRWRTDDPPYGCPSSRVEVVYARDYDAVVKERDDLRNYASQCSLNADNANTSLGCACDELKEMREAFGLVSTLAPHRIADPSHPIDWAKVIVKDVHEQQDRIVEEVRQAEAERDDARSYAAEIAQGVSHYTHDKNEPCIRCERDALKATVERVRAWAGPVLLESLAKALAEPVAYRRNAPPQPSTPAFPDSWYCSVCYRTTDEPTAGHGWGKCRA